MDALVSMADAFIGVFRTSADVFVSLTTGIIPLIVVFLTAVNALVKFIGEDKVENFAKWAAQEGWMYVPVRYTLLPFVAVFMLTNPVCYTFGTFLPEKNNQHFTMLLLVLFIQLQEYFHMQMVESYSYGWELQQELRSQLQN